MAKLDKFPYFKTVKVDADLVSNIWHTKRKFFHYDCHYKSLFWLRLYQRIKGLPIYKRKYALTRKGRYSIPPTVFIQVVGDKKPLEIICKSNADAERVFKEVNDWVNTRKTEFKCKIPD